MLGNFRANVLKRNLRRLRAWKKSFLVSWYLILLLSRQHAFGYGNGRFWVDDVKCTGDEESIDKCSHRPWGRHNCLRYNQAGVICRMHRSDVIVEPKPSKASGEVWLCVLYPWSILITTPCYLPFLTPSFIAGLGCSKPPGWASILIWVL